MGEGLHFDDDDDDIDGVRIDDENEVFINASSVSSIELQDAIDDFPVVNVVLVVSVRSSCPESELVWIFIRPGVDNDRLWDCCWCWDCCCCCRSLDWSDGDGHDDDDDDDEDVLE